MASKLTDLSEKKRMENKAQKLASNTNITYAWLRADNAETNLTQLRNSHKRKAVVGYHDRGKMTQELAQALESIQNIKTMIQDRGKVIKLAQGKK